MFREWGFLLSEIWGLLALAGIVGLIAGWIIWGRRAEVSVAAPDTGALRHLSVSKDGTAVLAYSDLNGSFDIWTMPLATPSAAKKWLATPAREDTPSISPSGQLIAYVSNQTGRFEIYIAPAAQAENSVRVSPDGGLETLFSRDGRELFFRRGDEMWASGITTGADGVIDARTPTLLFKGNQLRAQEPPGRAYDVSPDGSRFFMLRDDRDSDQIHVIFNFFELLKQKVP